LVCYDCCDDCESGILGRGVPPCFAGLSCHDGWESAVFSPSNWPQKDPIVWQPSCAMRESMIGTLAIIQWLVLAAILVIAFRHSYRADRVTRFSVVFTWVALAVDMLAFAAFAHSLNRGDREHWANSFPDGPACLLMLVCGWFDGLLVAGAAVGGRRMVAIATEVGRPEGRFSLIWALGCMFFVELVHFPSLGGSYWYLLIRFFAVWGVSLPFALSGLRRGDVRNRIYAGVSVTLFLVNACALLWYG